VRDKDEKACDSINFNNECDSNLMSRSDPYREKYESPSFLTHRGTPIFVRDEDEKACDLINFTNEFDSNITSQSDSQKEI
jgi:hypothetical protein